MSSDEKKNAELGLPPADGPTVMDRIMRRSWSKWDRVVPSYIRSACLAWQFIKFSFQFYLCTRQLTVLNERRRIPIVLREKLSQDTFELARNYNKELVYLEMFSCFYWMAYEVWNIYYAGHTKYWFLSGPLLEWLDIWPVEWDQEYGESIVFIVLSCSVANLVRIPMDIYKYFVIEEKYGFNRMSYWNFAWDRLKVTFVELMYAVPMGLSILWIVRTTGTLFFLWVWLFCFIWVLATIAIYPNVIAPMFNEYTVLREGRLRDRLHRLAHFIGFPLEEILVLHQNWKSNHRDAYFYGMLAHKRIVLYDTMLEGYPEADTEKDALFRRVRTRHLMPNPDANQSVVPVTVPPDVIRLTNNAASRASLRAQRPAGQVSRTNVNDKGFTEYEIEAICARLMGHWVMSHSIYEMIFPEISLFLFFLIFSYIYQNSSLFMAFDVPKNMDKPILLGLRLLYADVMDIYTVFVGMVMMNLSRGREIDADAFATKLGYGDDLIDGIIQMNKENLGYPYYDTWYWNWHYSEPSLLQRLNAIEREMQLMEWKNH